MFERNDHAGPKVESFETAEKASEKACEHLNKILEESVKEGHENPVLLLVSGGSSLTMLGGVDTKWLTSYLTIALLDERCTTVSEDSNSSALRRSTFFEKASANMAQFIRTEVESESETPEQLAARMEEGIQDWMHRNPDGRIIAIQGMGPDGHTAGILSDTDQKRFTDRFERPYDPQNPHGFVVGYETEVGKHRRRATVTLSFLRKAIYRTIFFAVGEDKQEPLLEGLHGRSPLYQLPVGVLQSMEGEVTVFTSPKDFEKEKQKQK